MEKVKINNIKFTIQGVDLIGIKYNNIFPYFQDSENAFQIIHGDFVSTEDGSGAVHIAPGFGEDDFIISRNNNIETICPVDDAGCFKGNAAIKLNKEIHCDLGGRNETINLYGKQVFETNDDIIKYLKAKKVKYFNDENEIEEEKNLWLETEQYTHNYPHCWRTDTPLIYKAVSSWYVEVIKIKDRMCELNKEINWIPEHIKDGQFGKWLENARDWSITRNRFWGAPVPVWRFKIQDDEMQNQENKNDILNKLKNAKDIEIFEKNNIIVFGSIEELENFFETKVEDLHRPYIDDLKLCDKNGNVYLQRVEDVLDCWFESGSMPFASVHYPFADKEIQNNDFNSIIHPPKNLPADFIVEYVGQTRGWFYTLMVLSTALFDKVPFKNCICHGVILDENAQKLSKRLRNYPDPKEVFETLGSDAMRWGMIKTQVMRGMELKIDKKGIIFEDSIKTILNPLWNAYTFFKTYQAIDQIEITKEVSMTNKMDQYILLELQAFKIKYFQAMDAYDTPTACIEAENFVDILNNWYIRRSKNRFWSNEKDLDKRDAYNTLYIIIEGLCVLLAPLLPFLTEKIYSEL